MATAAAAAAAAAAARPCSGNMRALGPLCGRAAFLGAKCVEQRAACAAHSQSGLHGPCLCAARLGRCGAIGHVGSVAGQA